MIDRGITEAERIEYCSRQTLREVDFEEGIVSIGSNAFHYDTSTDWVLRTIKLPTTLETIGNNAFSGLSKLEKILIPQNVDKIDLSSFQGNSNDFVLYGYSDSEAMAYAGDSEILFVAVDRILVEPDFILPKALQIIEEEAFCGGSFVCLMVPENVLTVGKRAFADCPNLQQVIIMNDNTVFADDAFTGLEDIIFVCGAGSYAERYALDHDYLIVE